MIDCRSHNMAVCAAIIVLLLR